MNQQPTEELLPCPFCGNKVGAYTMGIGYTCSSDMCSVSGALFSCDQWQNRIIDTSTVELVQELRDALLNSVRNLDIEGKSIGIDYGVDVIGGAITKADRWLKENV